MMYDHISTKDVDGVDTLHGYTENIPYKLVCLKDPDYIMKTMSNYGVLLVPCGQK